MDLHFGTLQERSLHDEVQDRGDKGHWFAMILHTVSSLVTCQTV